MSISDRIEDLTYLLHDNISRSPKSNSKLSKMNGLQYPDMNRSGYLTYSVIKNAKNDYESIDHLNIVNNYNEYDHNELYNKEDKDMYDWESYKSINECVKEIASECRNKIDQQSNHTMRQSDIDRVLGIKDKFNDNCNWSYNLLQLMNKSEMVETYRDGNKRMWKSGNNLEYIPNEYNNSNEHISRGESMVSKFFENNNMNYTWQKTFKDCKDQRCLPYDFYFEYNDDEWLLEYQGKQHFEPIEFFGGQKQFKIQQKHDKIKKEYALENGYKLIEVPYTIDTEKKLNLFLNNSLKMQ